MSKKKAVQVYLMAGDITDLIAKRHADDVFVPECNDGPAYGGQMRMDAWAMKKSWAHPHCTAYEIKVSRPDFLRDNKWHGYLGCCNSFYFVCPTGIIQPEEVGEEAGLLWVAKTGTRLYTKKKAPYRDVEIPSTVYQYVLMSRIRIARAQDYRTDQVEYWQEWMAKKDEKKELGYNVSKKIRKLVEERVRGVHSRNEMLQEEIEKLKEVKEVLSDLGIRPSGYWSVKLDVENKVKKFLDGLPPEFDKALEAARVKLAEAQFKIAKMRRDPLNLEKERP